MIITIIIIIKIMITLMIIIIIPNLQCSFARGFKAQRNNEA